MIDPTTTTTTMWLLFFTIQSSTEVTIFNWRGSIIGKINHLHTTTPPHHHTTTPPHNRTTTQVFSHGPESCWLVSDHEAIQVLAICWSSGAARGTSTEQHYGQDLLKPLRVETELIGRAAGLYPSRRLLNYQISQYTWEN